MSDMTIDFAPMKNAKEIFARLRRGYHYCNADRELFHELSENEDAYKKLFGIFGWTLHRNSGETVDYYFMQQPDDARSSGDGTEDRSNTSFRVTVLITAIFDSGATNSSTGDSRVMEILTGARAVDKNFFDSVFDDTVAADRLERFSINRSEVQKIVKQMLMFNYLREEEGGKLRFLPPVYRVLDTVKRMAARVNGKQISEQVEGVA